MRPANSILWHDTVFEWLGRFLGEEDEGGDGQAYLRSQDGD